MTGLPRTCVAVLGRRMHYAVAIAFHERGRLERFFTDLYLPGGAGWLGRLPWGESKRLGGRYEERLAGADVVSFPGLGVGYWWRRRRRADLSRTYFEFGQRFQELAGRRLPEGAECLYAMNQCAETLFAEPWARGRLKVLEQCIVPLRVERALLGRFGGVSEASEWDRKMMAREEAEWAAADVIVCPSRFVAESLPEGVRGKAVLVPYGYGEAGEAPARRREPGRPLRVLLLGAVGYRKGAAVAGRVARTMAGTAEFHWYGPSTMAPGEREETLGPVVTHAPVPHGEVAELMARHDVLFLPSVCEGSATVLYEAMNCGLPIVTSTGAGAPFEDGECGRVLDAEDAAGFAEALGRLARGGDEYARAAEMAVSRRGEFTAAAYRERLRAAVASEFAKRGMKQ